MDKIAKAIASAVLAGYALFDMAQADDVITRMEWQRIVIAVIVSGLVTWAVPNAKPGVQTERTTPTE
jgi:ribulose 1,5-bisphosphate synthetase/thiazole synthase